MKTGGSNYISINGLPSETPVIGTYHEHPDEVADQLPDMFEHGQRKITLVLWYAPLNFPAAHDNRWRHVLNSYGGALSEQHQENLVALIGLIKQAGYTALHFRFAAQGKAAVSDWETWKGQQFNENWNFINNTRNLIDANRNGLPVIFDLALEHANEQLDTNSVHQLYCRRLWKLYTEAHGPNDSCAFSVIHGGAGLRPMIRRFKSAHLPLPSCYFFDAYGFEYQALTTAATVLLRHRELAKPVYMQETHYNDAQSYSDIKRAVGETGLNFNGIFQWPVVRDAAAFPDVYPKRFDNYLVEV